MEKKMLENLSLKTKQLFLGSLLLIAPVLTQDVKAQTQINIKTVNMEKEDLLLPTNSMMDKIYSLKMCGDLDKDYISIMEEFQQGGIDLCNIYEMNGEDAKLLENAKVNAAELKEDQKQLKTFYDKYVSHITAKTEHQALMMKILNIMMRKMKEKAQSEDLNKDYVTIMSWYNWASTELAKVELAYGKNIELKNISVEFTEEFSGHESFMMEWTDKSIVKK